MEKRLAIQDRIKVLRLRVEIQNFKDFIFFFSTCILFYYVLDRLEFYFLRVRFRFYTQLLMFNKYFIPRLLSPLIACCVLNWYCYGVFVLCDTVVTCCLCCTPFCSQLLSMLLLLCLKWYTPFSLSTSLACL